MSNLQKNNNQKKSSTYERVEQKQSTRSENNFLTNVTSKSTHNSENSNQSYTQISKTNYSTKNQK